ncbi:hypothetical protein G6F40_015679 [Rhizopus arrhizus]|nr:hypothetical protein G6F40_015679 [Rhizopus arrhizus]
MTMVGAVWLALTVRPSSATTATTVPSIGAVMRDCSWARAGFSCASAASYSWREVASAASICCWRANSSSAWRRVACCTARWAVTWSSEACALSTWFCWVVASISAIRSPSFTVSPSCTFSDLIWPEACAPTLTSL